MSTAKHTSVRDSREASAADVLVRDQRSIDVFELKYIFQGRSPASRRSPHRVGVATLSYKRVPTMYFCVTQNGWMTVGKRVTVLPALPSTRQPRTS